MQVLIKIFIETGTYKGYTTRMASKHFDQVYTFEIVEELIREAVQLGAQEGCANIKYFLGDSVQLLTILVPQLTQPTMFFLDAHISGPESGFNGKELVPL
jgi:predicted O-methyltransferase YrrM